MAFNLSNLTAKKTWWMDILFYFVVSVLIAAVFCYLIFVLKIYLQKQKMAGIESNIAVYGSEEQKAYEKKILDYKKMVDDFASILGKHKISSNLFNFIEDHTLPSVWFSNFDMAHSTSEIRLLGEAENMLVLSNQVKILEENKEYIKSINVLNSQVGAGGKINFILNVSLEPKVFTYE
ncbi:MAG: hypothetical protein Q7S10_02235 [bacterium]|nr:hypothetical protein [bacterium]